MKISSLIDIIDGELLNTPSISFIYSFKTKAKKVKEADLFIARNTQDIEIAIKNGAYAIVLEDDYEISDNEIAWIKVKSLDLVLKQLIRYRLANFNLKAYSCNKAIYFLLKIFSNDLNMKFIPSNLDSFIKSLNDTDDDTILISYDKELLDSIYPKNNILEATEYKITNLIEHSLFESSFSYDDSYYSRLKISSLYINEFLFVKEYLDTQLDFSKLKNFYSLKPIFLDKKFKITEYGRSDKLILIQNNEELIQKELNYIKDKYKYAKTIYISSEKLDFIDDEQYILDNLDNLKAVLRKMDFNAVYLTGFTFEEIFKSLNKEEDENLLF